MNGNPSQCGNIADRIYTIMHRKWQLKSACLLIDLSTLHFVYHNVGQILLLCFDFFGYICNLSFIFPTRTKNDIFTKMVNSHRKFFIPYLPKRFLHPAPLPTTLPPHWVLMWHLTSQGSLSLFNAGLCTLVPD